MSMKNPIHELRQLKGLSQDELAEKVFVTRQATHSCSCLENPRDRGAWWAAVSGVAQSRTRLKRLSSSSSSRAFKKDVRSLGQTPLFYR